MKNRKQQEFETVIMKSLKEKFGYTNDLEVPKLVKIVINRGVNSDDAKNANLLEEFVKDITMISGQKPIQRLSTKSIATFKLREGLPIGIKVTLRKTRMYAFLDKFISIASPRVRDFRGFDISGDGHGNFTVGVPDQRIFVEAEDRSNRGFHVTIVTTANTDAEGKALLEAFGFPFVKAAKVAQAA